MKRLTKRDVAISLVCYVGGALVGSLIVVVILGLVL